MIPNTMQAETKLLEEEIGRVVGPAEKNLLVGV